MLVGIISTFLHEIGHIGAILLKNHQIKEINIGFFYIDIIDNNRRIVNCKDNLFILLSGSAFNFVTALLSGVLYCFIDNYFFCYAMYINLAIGIMNLLPISSLDGGQITFIILNKFFKFKTANILYNIISLIFLIPLAFIGFMILLNSKYNFSLLFICCYLIYTLLLKNEDNYLQDMV